MLQIHEIKALLYKEAKLEFRNKYAVNGIILYLAATCFICYLSFKNTLSPPAWNALFWVIILFSAINAVTKSFAVESKARHLYTYSIASAQSVIIAKTIYNTALLIALAVIGYAIYSLFTGNNVQNQYLFFLTIILGSAGISGTLTLTSALASKTESNFGLMAVLSFPVIMPLILVIIHLSKNAIDGLDWTVSTRYIVTLGLLDVITVTLSYLLFPYLWRE